MLNQSQTPKDNLMTLSDFVDKCTNANEDEIPSMYLVDDLRKILNQRGVYERRGAKQEVEKIDDFMVRLLESALANHIVNVGEFLLSKGYDSSRESPQGTEFPVLAQAGGSAVKSSGGSKEDLNSLFEAFLVSNSFFKGGVMIRGDAFKENLELFALKSDEYSKDPATEIYAIKISSYIGKVYDMALKKGMENEVAILEEYEFRSYKERAGELNMIIAVAEGNVAEVKKLLKTKVNLRALDYGGKSILERAEELDDKTISSMISGKILVLTNILKNKIIERAKEHECAGKVPENNLQEVKGLLSMGANPYAISLKDSNSVLGMASFAGDLDLIKLFLSKDIKGNLDVEEVVNHSLRISAAKGHEDVIKEFFLHGNFNVQVLIQSAIEAASCNHKGALKILLDKVEMAYGSDHDVNSGVISKKILDIFKHASVDKVSEEDLLELKEGYPTCCNQVLSLLLNKAIALGNADEVNAVLSLVQNVDSEGVGYRELKALVQAVSIDEFLEDGRRPIVDILLSRLDGGTLRDPPISNAALIELKGFMLRKPKADIDQVAFSELRAAYPEFYKNTIIFTLQEAAIFGDKNEVRRILSLDEGITSEIDSNAGFTALINAASNGHWGVVQILLGKIDAVPVAESDKEIVSMASLKMIEVLIKGKKEDVSQEALLGLEKAYPVFYKKMTSSILLDAVVIGDEEEVERVLSLGVNIDLDAKDGKGFTALMRAAMLGNENIISQLLAAGASEEITDEYGCNALMIAVNLNEVEAVNSLSNNPATLVSVNKTGKTPLMMADDDSEVKNILTGKMTVLDGGGALITESPTQLNDSQGSPRPSVDRSKVINLRWGEDNSQSGVTA